MTLGRTSEFKEEYIAAVDHYLEWCQDEYDDKGRLVVKSPTMEGFARFINVARSSLYLWEKDHPDFSDALDKIRGEQKERLINKGLSGDYNPTIAKLILSANHGMREKADITTDDKPIKGNTIVFKDFSDDEADSE
jgi:hypothetical protein